MRALAFALVGLLAAGFGMRVLSGCSTDGRPICRCASDCDESQICLDTAGHAVKTCIDPVAAAGACVPAGTSNDDAGVEPPEVEPELFDLLWTKRDLAQIEPNDSSASDSSASDSSGSDSHVATSSSDDASSSVSDSSASASSSSSDSATDSTTGDGTTSAATGTSDASATSDSNATP